jgi:hypothetical protein
LEVVQNIATCGMNCNFCMAFLRKKNKCEGCKTSDAGKPISILKCKIRSCEKQNSEFCYTCSDFPCKSIKHIDKRYRTKYNMSMIENLEYIKEFGVSLFVTKERERWKCAKCGGPISIHKGGCLKCAY